MWARGFQSKLGIATGGKVIVSMKLISKYEHFSWKFIGTSFTRENVLVGMNFGKLKYFILRNTFQALFLFPNKIPTITSKSIFENKNKINPR